MNVNIVIINGKLAHQVKVIEETKRKKQVSKWWTTAASDSPWPYRLALFWARSLSYRLWEAPDCKTQIFIPAGTSYHIDFFMRGFLQYLTGLLSVLKSSKRLERWLWASLRTWSLYLWHTCKSQMQQQVSVTPTAEELLLSKSDLWASSGSGERHCLKKKKNLRWMESS